VFDPIARAILALVEYISEVKAGRAKNTYLERGQELGNKLALDLGLTRASPYWTLGEPQLPIDGNSSGFVCKRE
jgi:hypothetical protein